jgi:hypothetical protein
MQKGEIMGKIPDEDTSLRIKRKTLSHLAILTRNLHFHSMDELIAVLVDIVAKKGWDKTDLESIQRYGKIIEVMSGTAKSDEEMYEKIGIKGDVVLKLDETTKITGKVKKKKKSKEEDKA